ncbi:MAG: zinc ribbon domain-containing protein [Clostridia bacterium]
MNNNNENNQNSKPIPYSLFRIIGGISLIIGFCLLLSMILGTESFLSGGVSMTSISIRGFLWFIFSGLGMVLLSIGFRPIIAKYSIKSAKYIQKENSSDLRDLSSDAADIHSDAIKKTVKSIKSGLSEEEKIYCSNCGKENKKSANFCNNCGENLKQ